MKEAIRKNFSIAWRLTASFTSCVIQGHSGGNKVDPSLVDNVEIPYNWSEYINHVGSSLDLFSVNQSGLIAGETNRFIHSRESCDWFSSRWTVRRDETTKGTVQNEVESYQDAVYWINLKHAQEKGLAFSQTQSNSIIFHDSVPTDCLEKVVNTETDEILCQNASLSPRPPPKIILKDTWQGSTRRSSSAWNLVDLGEPTRLDH